MRNNGEHLLPEAYLCNGTVVSGWMVFSELQVAAPVGPSNPCHPAPRLPSLIIGQSVDCLGLVWSGQGNRSTTALGVTLVAIVRMRVRAGKKRASSGATKLPQWRSYAVVGLRGAPNLRL